MYTNEAYLIQVDIGDQGIQWSLFNTSRYWITMYTNEAYLIQVDIGDQGIQMKLI